MSYVPGLLSIILFSLLLMVPGFVAAYLFHFRSRTWGSVLLSMGMVLAVSGWLASFSVAGFVLLLSGVTFFGAGAEGMTFARRAAR